MAKKITRIDRYDVEELACKIVDLDYDEIDANEEVIEEKLLELYNIDLDQFAAIVNKLVPMIDVGKSALSGTTYKGFADVDKQMWLLKIEANS